MLGDRLKAARIKCGYTQQQVAELLGIDRSSYTYYETGKSKVSAPTLNLLAIIFGVSYEDLFQEAGTASVLHSDIRKKPYDGDADTFATASLSSDERKILAQVRLIRYMGKENELVEALNAITRQTDNVSCKAGKDE